MSFAPVIKLPNEPFFRRLVENGQSIQSTIFQDSTCQVDAGYSRLLHDIVTLRQRIYDVLPKSMFDERGMISGETPYICILASGNYEFVVAAFAVLALGGALVPLAPAVLPEEAFHFLVKCKCQILLSSTQCSQLAMHVGSYSNSEGHVTSILPIASGLLAGDQALSTSQITTDESWTIDPTRPSLILFTSGSTGPPKGVVHTRRFFYSGYGTASNDLFLTHRPAHWIGGLRSILNLVISGTKQEVIAAHEIAIWERLKEGGITMLCCVIPMWHRLMIYYQTTLSVLPTAELEKYLRPARSLRVARIGGAAPQQSLLDFWRNTVGIPLEVTYGCTETGGPGMMTDSTCDRNLKCNLGKVEAKVLARLAEGDHGEILIKNPLQFSHYLDDPEATKAAFTDDGYFKTGDNGYRVGDQYLIEGRASTDFVRFHGFKVPVLEVEMCLLSLPIVKEACIVSVPDKDASTRVAAVVRFAPTLSEAPNLETIRRHLAPKLANFKMPTALRVLEEGEVLPMTFTGKALRKKIVNEFFNMEGGYTLPQDVEVWDLSQSAQNVSHKAWDWAGLQGC